MTDYDPLTRARRQQRRHRDLGPDARCALCGETELDVLEKVPRRLLEEHHPFGLAHAPEETVILCRNCHARCTAAQVDDGVPLEPQLSRLERFVAIAEGAASIGGVVTRALQRGASNMREHVFPFLDEHLPDWRKNL